MGATRKGSPNRNKQFLLNRLQDMYGADFHPIMTIAKNCNELQVDAEDKEGDDRVKALVLANAEWSRIAEYTEPKLKAVDHTVQGDMSLTIEEVIFEGKAST